MNTDGMFQEQPDESMGPAEQCPNFMKFMCVEYFKFCSHVAINKPFISHLRSNFCQEYKTGYIDGNLQQAFLYQNKSMQVCIERECYCTCKPMRMKNKSHM